MFKVQRAAMISEHDDNKFSYPRLLGLFTYTIMTLDSIACLMMPHTRTNRIRYQLSHLSQIREGPKETEGPRLLLDVLVRGFP